MTVQSPHENRQFHCSNLLAMPFCFHTSPDHQRYLPHQIPLLPDNNNIEPAYQCITRLSVAFIAADAIRNIIKDIVNAKYESIKVESIDNSINKNAHNAFYIDKRNK